MKKTSHFRRQQPADSRSRALSSDTSPKIETLQIQLWREASPTRKGEELARKVYGEISHAI
jgi:hypothetical protein